VSRYWQYPQNADPPRLHAGQHAEGRTALEQGERVSTWLDQRASDGLPDDEIAQLARASLAEDGRDRRQRMGGARTLSLDAYLDEGYNEVDLVIDSGTRRSRPEGARMLEEGARPDIESLTATQQEGLTLIYWERRSFRDASKALGLSPSAAQGRVRRAIDALARLIILASGRRTKTCDEHAA
jgi:hypothetical protein